VALCAAIRYLSSLYEPREGYIGWQCLFSSCQSSDNQSVFGLAMGPKEARAFIETQADRSIADPDSFEDQALK
jgi:hypothetical protein